MPEQASESPEAIEAQRLAINRTFDELLGPPADCDMEIWRYMDKSKFDYLLKGSSLYFARLDILDDRFEGSLSQPTVSRRTELNAQYGEHVLRSLAETSESAPKWLYVNCWHMNPGESVAMWKLYAPEKESVAIRSTYGKLRAALPEEIQIGRVQYKDYTADLMPDGNMYFPALHKRSRHQFECELRALYLKPLPTLSNDTGNTSSPLTAYMPNPGGTWDVVDGVAENPNDFVTFNVDLEALLECVVVEASATTELIDSIRGQITQLGLSVPVERSSLADSPGF